MTKMKQATFDDFEVELRSDDITNDEAPTTLEAMEASLDMSDMPNIYKSKSKPKGIPTWKYIVGTLLLLVLVTLSVLLAIMFSNNNNSVKTTETMIDELGNVNNNDPMYFDSSNNNDSTPLSTTVTQSTNNDSTPSSTTVTQSTETSSWVNNNTDKKKSTNINGVEEYAYSPTETQLYTIVRAHSPFLGEEFKDEFSYQNKALRWLEKTSDSSIHTVNRILQRYALACIYYATNGVKTPWTDQMFKDTPGYNEEEEQTFSVRNNNSENIFNWITEDGWLEHDDECSWFRISCNEDGFVTQIDLYSNRLSGSFPAEVTLLKDTLLEIDLYNNLVYNVGPAGNDFLGELTQLRKLYYASTSFQYDGIPPAIGKLTNLVEYDCSYTLYFGELKGYIFKDLNKLEYMRIDGNSFKSSIPAELAQLPNLQYFYAQYTDLTGDLSFMKLPNALEEIVEIWIDQNPNLVGTIPSEIGNLQTLRSLSITQSGLTGTIPTEMGNLRLEQAWLYSNKLSGKIPSELGNLVRLKRLGLEDNLLSGNLPQEICKNRDPIGLLLRLETDCQQGGSVKCTCCTCCGPDCSADE